MKNLDSLTIAALADELRREIMGGRVQKITQLNPLSFGLELYAQRRRRYLLLHANPAAPRIYVSDLKPRRGEAKATPLQQLFRKYLQGARLMTIEQPGFERSLICHFSGEAGETSLIVELRAGRSNLIFTATDNTILALARPLAGKKQRQRVLLPGQPYIPPAPQEGLNPLALTSADLRSLIQQARPDQTIAKTLVSRLVGLSPLLAAEIVHRTHGDAAALVTAGNDPAALLAALQALYNRLDEHRWQPHQIEKASGEIIALAPIPVSHLPYSRPIESLSAAIEIAFEAETEPDGYAAARAPVAKRLAKEVARLERRLGRLETDAAALQNPDIHKEKGDAILAYSWQIEAGQTTLTTLWGLDGDELRISLDPALSPAENAQRYFARYRKAKRAADIIPRQQTDIQQQLDYVLQLQVDLALAETRPEIDAIATAIKHRRAEASAPSTGAGEPRRFVSPGGFTIWVGKNARQNHRLITNRANANDWWLHAKNVPGAHVIIGTAQGEPGEEDIACAAQWAAYYSKNRGETQVVVSVTRRKHVRPVKGAPPGLVTVRQEQTITVPGTAPNS